MFEVNNSNLSLVTGKFPPPHFIHEQKKAQTHTAQRDKQRERKKSNGFLCDAQTCSAKYINSPLFWSNFSKLVTCFHIICCLDEYQDHNFNRLLIMWEISNLKSFVIHLKAPPHSLFSFEAHHFWVRQIRKIRTLMKNWILFNSGGGFKFFAYYLKIIYARFVT